MAHILAAKQDVKGGGLSVFIRHNVYGTKIIIHYYVLV